MFQHMLSRVDQRHREQGSRLFRILFTYQKVPWPSAKTDMHALGLALVEDYHISPTPIRPHDIADREDMCLTLKRRLLSRCGGLLELVDGHHPHCFCNTTPHNPHIHREVRFMHRTVFEFLNMEQTWELECLKTLQGDDFDASTALSLYVLHLALESMHSTPCRTNQTSSYLWEGLRWAALADTLPRGKSEKFLDSMPFFLLDAKFENTASKDPALRRLYERSFKADMEPGCLPITQIAVEAGAVNYVRKQPRLEAPCEERQQHHSTRGSRSKSWPLLIHAMHKPIIGGDFRISNLGKSNDAELPSEDMLRLLLQRGCDPNEMMYNTTYPRGSTPWTIWITNQTYSFLNGWGKMRVLALVKEFLLGGADPAPQRVHGLVANLIPRGADLYDEPGQRVRDEAHAILLLIRELKSRPILRPGPGHKPSCKDSGSLGEVDSDYLSEHYEGAAESPRNIPRDVETAAAGSRILKSPILHSPAREIKTESWPPILSRKTEKPSLFRNIKPLAISKLWTGRVSKEIPD
ncbi:hypothetical protein DL98DRAFT_657021 [Cadophora sp. DSE1049]|nr:hypothetical protein DL98DRAFT_657021 [Cadophora sp. DSE1049]